MDVCLQVLFLSYKRWITIFIRSAICFSLNSMSWTAKPAFFLYVGRIYLSIILIDLEVIFPYHKQYCKESIMSSQDFYACSPLLSELSVQFLLPLPRAFVSSPHDSLVSVFKEFVCLM
jgi:hypothetical protein